MDELRVELVFKKRQIKDIPSRFDSLIAQYKQFESADRISVTVPRHWEGFKDGTIVDLFKTFNEGIYVALAYLTVVDERTYVTDFNGEPVDRYEITIQDRRAYKYVKKRLRVIKLLDKDNEVFEVKGYMLDLSLGDPVVEILSIYSAGRDSGFQLKTFIKK